MISCLFDFQHKTNHNNRILFDLFYIIHIFPSFSCGTKVYWDLICHGKLAPAKVAFLSFTIKERGCHLVIFFLCTFPNHEAASLSQKIEKRIHWAAAAPSTSVSLCFPSASPSSSWEARKEELIQGIW